MALSKDDILNAIAEMSVMEVVELVQSMEDKFGVSAAAAVAAAPAAAGGDAGGAAPLEAEVHEPGAGADQGRERGDLAIVGIAGFQRPAPRQPVEQKEDRAGHHLLRRQWAIRGTRDSLVLGQRLACPNDSALAQGLRCTTTVSSRFSQ